MEREQRLRIEVVVARFIDDPQQSVRRRVGVGERDIDLPRLQRRRIAIVVDADNQLIGLMSYYGYDPLPCVSLRRSIGEIPDRDHPGLPGSRHEGRA